MMTTGMHIVSGEDAAASLSSDVGNTNVDGHNGLLSVACLVVPCHADIFCISCCSCVGWRYVRNLGKGWPLVPCCSTAYGGILPVEAAASLSLSLFANAGLRV